ncbi:glycoside hydrolase family 104 protein [Erwinia sp. P7711]|uniref:glycoside hydrolase family 24 protein n=1 Tax=Erwinia sp. P7711 TaxID=3141451 RepID=UPI0031877A87
MSVLPKLAWPVPSSNRGSDFANRDDVMTHLEGEATGWYMLGSNGMWHGGIHITNTTTPWCALSGKAASEAVDFPLPFKGEQAVRCMADGEVVAYRICRDYLEVPWETGPLSISGSFVLVRHYIQLGEKQESGLHFYTLYMHLAPYSAYDTGIKKTQWVVNDSLSAYSPEWVMSASTDNKGVSDSYRVATIPKGALVEWDAEDSSLRTTGHNGRRYGLVTFRGLSAEAKKKGTRTRLQEGQQYWILSDRNNLVSFSGSAACPSWWTHLQPPFAEPMQFDTVICPTPYPVSAGDSIGHLGYFQAPRDGGYDARYQVHIECLSADENLPVFLKNPEKVGESAPLYLKCPSGLPLFSKDLKTKAMVSNGRTSQGEAILRLSQVKTGKDPQKHEYWFLPYANGYVPKSNDSVETLSQYDLEKLGFATAVDEAPGFDHLDGKTPPKGLVREIYKRLFSASSNDIRVTHRAVPHNYQRLLNRIDGSISPYSPQEYLSAIHNPSYRDVRNKMIVKHPSEWYHKKSDPVWLPFLNNLTKDAPEWKTYSEAYIDKMAWMQDAAGLKLGPSLWHMHPVEFLAPLMRVDKNIKILRLRSFLRMIRIGEGTTHEDGYRTMFTGVKFTDFSRHPNIRQKANGVVSTAAGAYQFLYRTWINLQHRYSFSDFGQSNQDFGCIALIAGRKALKAVMEGKISEAIHLCRVEWASLPGSPHGQPTANKQMIMRKYEDYLAEEKQGKTTLHASSAEMEKFIKDNYPEVL